MIFAFIEDGTLEVHEDLASVQKAYEGVDVEGGAVHFYDADGNYLEARFTVPNRSGRILGAVGWVASGVFELVANPGADEDPFALALYETHSLAPNRWFTSLDHLKAELSGRGVAVDYQSVRPKET